MRGLRLLVVVLVALVAATAAVAASGPTLDKADISAAACKTGHARQLVNVTYKLVNNYDSGFAGNAWANDTVNRQLRIWRSKDTGKFCAQVRDTGGFVTFAGTSPSGFSTVSAGIPGRMNGGYVTTSFSGTYAPSYPEHGNLGTFDLQCTSATDCPGAYPSYKSYFSSTSSDDLAQWGWIYKAQKHHGTWLNQDDTPAAASGDITG
jgi:type II secretory pathway pseudopilin PulG